MKIPHHTNLTPELSDIVLNSPEIKPETILMLFSDLIQSKFIQEKIMQSGTAEENNTDCPSTRTTRSSSKKKKPASDNTEYPKEPEINDNPFEDKDGELEKSFYKSLIFFWGMIHKINSIQATPIIPDLSNKSKYFSTQAHKVHRKDSPAKAFPHSSLDERTIFLIHQSFQLLSHLFMHQLTEIHLLRTKIGNLNKKTKRRQNGLNSPPFQGM